MTALDVDELTILDWAMTLPCERKDHATKHFEPDPAIWDVLSRCHQCGHPSHYVLCESGRLFMKWAVLGHRRCGATGHWEDFVISCLPIPEAMGGAA